MHVETQVQDSYKNIRDFIEESALMHSFDHPNVLGLIGISLDKNSSPYIILPYMENGDLRTFLKNKREVATKSTDTGYPEVWSYALYILDIHAKCAVKLLEHASIYLPTIGSSV